MYVFRLLFRVMTTVARVCMRDGAQHPRPEIVVGTTLRGSFIRRLDVARRGTREPEDVSR